MTRDGTVRPKQGDKTVPPKRQAPDTYVGRQSRFLTGPPKNGKYRPKLIEVALPLGAINEAAAREKSIRHGHPSTLHLWWARRPLAATRAVIWASLVDDPSGDDSLTPEEQEEERDRLFKISGTAGDSGKTPTTQTCWPRPESEIDRCFPDGPPPILDPFAGWRGDSIGSAETWTRGSCWGLEPGGGAHQQGDDRDTASLCRAAASACLTLTRVSTPGIERTGPGSGRGSLRPLDARRG